jgi:hypothetical protein
LFVTLGSLQAAGTQGKAGEYKGALRHVLRLEEEFGVGLRISRSGVQGKRNWSTPTACAEVIVGWLTGHGLLD